MIKKTLGYRMLELLYVSIIPIALLGAFGWGWNIIKITQSSFDPLTGMLVVRIIGIFVAPIGAILGYL